jgi:hypothetical protein
MVMLFGAGCDNGGSSETDVSEPHDAGTDDGPIVILDGGGAPAKPPDGASKCPAGPCNYQTGAGCSGATPTCMPASDGNGGITPACAAAGAGKSGAACAQPSDCAAGYFCAEKTCHKLCCGGDWSACPSADEHCITAISFSDGNGGTRTTGAMLCYPVNTCDALAPGSCSAPGTTCQIVDPTGATACYQEGSGGVGEPCPCKGGFTCVIGAAGGICRRLCKAVEGGGEPSCKDGEGICTHYTRDPSGVGECTPD